MMIIYFFFAFLWLGLQDQSPGHLQFMFHYSPGPPVIIVIFIQFEKAKHFFFNPISAVVMGIEPMDECTTTVSSLFLVVYKCFGCNTKVLKSITMQRFKYKNKQIKNCS